MRASCILLLALASLLTAGEAAATMRTYCFDGFKFRDDRYNCPRYLNHEWEECKQDWVDWPPGADQYDGYYSTLVGAVFQLWDKDSMPEDPDDYIGVYVVTEPGRVCVDFDWENSPGYDGEANPDPFVKFINRVYGQGRYLYLRDAYGNVPPPIVFTAYTDCTPGIECDQNSPLFLSVDASSTVGGGIQLLDGGFRYLNVFGQFLWENLWLFYPSVYNVPISVAYASIYVNQDFALDAQVLPHEAGHALHKQLLLRSDLGLDYSLHGNESPRKEEYQKTAMAEGFASFVSVGSWWDPEDPSASPQVYPDPDYLFDAEDPSPVEPCSTEEECRQNAGMALHVTRALWDLADVHNEAGTAGECTVEADDLASLSLSDVVGCWLLFPNGTGNRQDNESDVDGRNTWDYFMNCFNYGGFNEVEQTLVYHNCLQGSDFD